MSSSGTSPDHRQTLLLFGAGGHGRVVGDAALLTDQWREIMASDGNPSFCRGALIAGISLRPVEAARALSGPLHVAIGSNTAREREASAWGHDRLVSIIHPAATVSASSHVGAGCFLAAGSVTAPGAVLAAGVIINHGAVVDHDAQVGAFSHIAPHATLGGGAVIGQRVLVGSGAVVLPLMRVADDVVIGAGAVVAAPITQAGTYAGVPARRIA